MNIPAEPTPGTGSLSLQTRHSLLSRLRGQGDEQGWREFFERYWRLIYGFARRAGLNDADAQDIVQEVMVGLPKGLADYRRQPGASFKSWLLTIVRRRLADHWRRRLPREQRTVPLPECEAGEHGQEDAALERLWQEEWEGRLFEAAAQRVQQRVGARNYLIFDMLVRQGTALREVCRCLGVSAAQVYLAKHRVGRLMKQEAQRLREGLA